MAEWWQFIFSSFWVWLGTVVLFAAPALGLEISTRVSVPKEGDDA